MVAMLAQGGQPEKTVPDWALVALGRMKKEGLLVGYPDGLGHREPTRPACAVAVGASARYLDELLRKLRDEIKFKFDLDHPNKMAKDVDRVCLWPSQADDLLRLTIEFAPELLKLGEDTEAMSAMIRRDRNLLLALPERMRPFPDIPRDHWAAGAANALKRAGILVGYPDGHFRG